MIINRRNDTGFNQLRLHNPAVAGYIFIVVLNFVTLNRKPRVVAAVVAGHIVVCDPEYVEGEAKAEILVAIVGQAATVKPLSLGEIRRLLDPGWNIGPDVADRYSLHRSDERQFIEIDAKRRRFHHLVVVRTGKVTHGEAVWFRHLAKKVHARDTARAGHVLGNKRGLAGYMLGEMTRDNSSFDVSWPAGSIINHKSYVFALIERTFCCGRSAGKKDKTNEP